MAKKLRLWVKLVFLVAVLAVGWQYYSVGSFGLNLDFLGSGSQEAAVSEVSLELSKLSSLEEGHYGLWGAKGEDAFLLGEFNINMDGNLVTLEGESLGAIPSSMDLKEFEFIFVTLEGETADPETYGIILLSGEIILREEGYSAVLTYLTDFTTVSGNYILGTPTDDSLSNEKSGIWFIKISDEGEVLPGLKLPSLSADWVYEGWVEHDGVMLSTGRFSDTSNPDEYIYSEESTEDYPGKNFPGEDFLNNAPEGLEFPLDLTDGSSTVFISVEPNIGGMDPTGDGPFSLRPLTATIPEGADDVTNYGMLLNLRTVPTGEAKIN